MSVETTPVITDKDREILRRLGDRIAEIAAEPVMKERRRLWKQLSALQGERPMLLAETSGVMEELPIAGMLACEGAVAREIEYGLRTRIFQYEDVRDDAVVEPYVYYSHVVHSSGYGVQAEKHRGDDGAGHGSYVWDAPLKKLPEDLERLHHRTFTYDAATTLQRKALLESTFDGVLHVKNKSSYWWSQGLTWAAIDLIGLEALMLLMYDEPDGLQALMAFLRDDHLQTLDWFEQQGLLTLNNDDAYIGSGSIGYTDLLPQADAVPGAPVRLKDLWGLSESQETVSVSPAMFEEFVFPYQLPVISRFGLSYYGCCEPVNNRWHIIKQIPNLRRVSVSPWADEEAMAANLSHEYIYCRKPNPAYVSTKWDEAVIREDLRNTLTLTKGQQVEFALKDVHTLAHEPWRLGRWCDIAREEIERIYG